MKTKFVVLILSTIFYGLTQGSIIVTGMAVPGFIKEQLKKKPAKRKKEQNINYELLSSLTKAGMPKDLLNLTLEYLTADLVKIKDKVSTFEEIAKYIHQPHALVNVDGKNLFCGPWDDGIIKVLDAETEKLVWNLNGHTRDANDVIKLSDGTILSCGKDGNIIKWDLRTGKSLKKVTHTPDKKQCLLELKDGKIAVGSEKNGILIFDQDLNYCKTLKPLPEKYFNHNVKSIVEYQPNILISAAKLVETSLIEIWDVQNAKVLQSFYCKGPDAEIKLVDNEILIFHDSNKILYFQDQAETIKNYQPSKNAKKKRKVN